MKLCVYTIVKNEMKNIERWFESVKEADYVVVLDTGSTDGTWEWLQTQQGIITAQKTINPWRYDVGRNEALKLVPQDCNICVVADPDMFLIKGFCNEIKQFWEDGLGILEAGALFVNTGKIGNFVCHARRGAYWVYPVYEQIRAFGNKKVVSKILLNDEWVSNDRMNNYLSLIDLALAEYPEKKDYFLKEKQEILRNLEMCEVPL